MKTHINKVWLLFLPLAMSLLLVMSSCNQQPDQQANKDNDQKVIAEFKQNMREIGDAVSDAVDSEDTFAEKANDALDNFETKLENFEDNMEDSGEKVSDSTEKALDNLKQESGDLKQKLNELSDESGDNAEQLKANIKEGLRNFGANVKDFVNKDNQN